MKLTCLSIGNGFYFPASHILEFSGFSILLECPIDLSALTIFSPLNPTEPSFSNSLVKTIPWYKTLKNLHLWDPSLIDAILISTPAGMLGLPFLVQSGKFSGKIYATEATVKIGKMLIEEVIEMHNEFVMFYGVDNKSLSWMKWEEIEKMEEGLKKVLMGEDGEELGSWAPLYRKFSGNEDEMRSYLVNSTENSEEIDKINFICSCVVSSLIEGGSVLIPIGRLGIVLILLEQITQSLEASNLKVPIFMISSTAEEMLAFTNSAPEWLCKQRQENLFSGEALFGHVELMKEKNLNVFPVLHSSEFIMKWKEPCIVFSPHWSLRLGSAVHLLHRWHDDKRCLLILEQGVDAEAALLPFKPLAMKVLQCSFLSELRADKILPLLKVLQPKIVLFPEVLKPYFSEGNETISFSYYSENKTLRMPTVREHLEANLSTDLAFQLRPKKLTLKNNDTAIARLEGGRLLLRNGEYALVSSTVLKSSKKNAQIYWGSCDPAKLLSELNKKEIDWFLAVPKDDASVSSDEAACSIKLNTEGHDAWIHLRAAHTVICYADEAVTARVLEALDLVCDGI